MAGKRDHGYDYEEDYGILVKDIEKLLSEYRDVLHTHKKETGPSRTMKWTVKYDFKFGVSQQRNLITRIHAE